MEQTASAISLSPEVLFRLKELILEITQMKVQPEQVSDTANLFNDCGLDSTSVVDLVIGIEQVFQISIDEEELEIGLFQNLSTLGAFIVAKQQEGE